MKLKTEKFKEIFRKNIIAPKMWIKLLKKYSSKRRIVVIIVLAVTVWYAKSIPEVKEIKENKEVSYQSQVSVNLPNLTNKSPELIFKDGINAEKGDFYRIYFKAKADSEETIFVKVRNEIGEEMEIGSYLLTIPEDKDEKLKLKKYEFTFQSISNFNEIVFYKKVDVAKSEESLNWNDGNVYVYNVKSSRLMVKDNQELKNIIPVILGENEVSENEYVEATNDANFERKLSNEDDKVKQFFISNADFLLSVNINFKKIGTGGEGEYDLRIGVVNRETNQSRVLKKISFSTDAMDAQKKKDGLYSFDMSVPTVKGDIYYIEISNKYVDVDGGNFLEVNKIEDKNSYFILDNLNLVRAEGGEAILSGAKIEDFGNRLTYSYEAKNDLSEMLNLFDFSGEIIFDAEDKIIANVLKGGNYYTYKINTVYPIEKMRVKVKQKKSEEDENVKFEYSYDNKSWNEIKFVQKEKNGSREIDFNIKPDMANKNVIYFKVTYVGDMNRETRSFGLKEFKVDALLLKPGKIVK